MHILKHYNCFMMENDRRDREKIEELMKE